jgi:hypothetical protein
MQVTIELLLTELGISSQTLQESYVRYGKWITNTWLKSIWEKVDRFKITVEIAPLLVDPPREGDKWFMQAAMEAGVTNPEGQRILNRFRCHQQVLRFRCLGPGGKMPRQKIPESPPVRQNMVNSFLLLRNPPPNKPLQLWHQVLYSIAS